jgi:hypothetical protein
VLLKEPIMADDVINRIYVPSKFCFLPRLPMKIHQSCGIQVNPIASRKIAKAGSHRYLILTKTTMENHESEATVSDIDSKNPDEEASFYDCLASASPAYAALRKEKEAHSASKESTARDEERRRYFAKNAENGIVNPSLWPYTKHFQDVLVKANRRFFSRSPKRFADVGSAPGGLCHFLCKGLQWSGRAFSLSERQGGFKMGFGGGKRLKFSRFDMSQSHAWRQLLEKVSVDDKVPRFDFVNLGITLQWTPPPSRIVTNDMGEEAPSSDRDIQPPVVRNHRLVLQEIIRNELVFALKSLKQGGSLMITLPTSDHPNTLLYLSYLNNCTHGSIHILPTPKLTRKPVYVLVEKIEIDGQGVIDFLHFLESTEVTPANDAKWSVQGWNEARAVFEQCRNDLERLWWLQASELRKERLDSNSD